MNHNFALAPLTLVLGGIAYAQAPQGPQITPPVSELAQYPGFGHNPDSEMRAYVSDEAKRQQSIFQCMKAAGFEYHPETANVVRADAPAAARSKRPPSKNEQFVASLAGGRLTQYNTTLYGVADPNSETALWDPRSATGGGCWGNAIRAHPGVFSASNALTNEYVAMRREVVEDANVKSAEAKWASCMKSAGHSFSTIAEFNGVYSNNGEARGRPKVAPDQLEPMKTQSDQCMVQAKFSEVERAARVAAENRFATHYKATLNARRYTP